MANELAAWEKGRCTVPMFSGMGFPDGYCDKPANGPQLPEALLRQQRSMQRAPYCPGHCCPDHGGPRDGEPIVFQDGLTEQGRPMWCAVMPDFKDLQASEAGFSGDPNKAIADLRAAISRATANE